MGHWQGCSRGSRGTGRAIARWFRGHWQGNSQVVQGAQTQPGGSGVDGTVIANGIQGCAQNKLEWI